LSLSVAPIVIGLLIDGFRYLCARLYANRL
jgi:hypothetical protein